MYVSDYCLYRIMSKTPLNEFLSRLSFRFSNVTELLRNESTRDNITGYVAHATHSHEKVRPKHHSKEKLQ